MSEADQTTLELIHGAGMREFLEKGYKSASLRNIVKTAGVTTGAFYGYYDSKEELFEALVKDCGDWFLDCFAQCTQQEFADLPRQRQPENLSTVSGECMHEMFAVCL